MPTFDFPNSPDVNDSYAANGVTYVWDGARWNILLSGVSGGISLHTGVSPPVDPETQPLWWDSSNGKLYVWYDDGDSAQWVAVTVSTSFGDTLAIENITKALTDLGSASGTINISLDDGHHQKLILTDDATINPPATPTTEVITLKLLLGINAVAGVVVTWGTGIEPLGGTLPDFDLADNGVNYVILEGVPGVGWILDGGSVQVVGGD
jgi:hypothetical protein